LRKSAPTTYFGSWKKWLPIMKNYEARKPCYFATPPVQLIIALETSLKQILNACSNDMEQRFQLHCRMSNRVKDILEKWGLKLVPTSRIHAANTLSAVYLPKGVTNAQLLPKIASHGVVVAGGLHPKHAAEYFRIGHVRCFFFIHFLDEH
jgi:alanine-glyoxylate transaminase/serine-glyoxylate transaminase/serine-pyruvate transaminase